VAVGTGDDTGNRDHRLETVRELPYEEVGAARLHDGVGEVPDAAAPRPQVRLEHAQVPARAGEPGEVLVQDPPAGPVGDRFRRGGPR